jgi:hypothetical protein
VESIPQDLPFQSNEESQKKKKNPFTLTQRAFAQISSEYMQLK